MFKKVVFLVLSMFLTLSAVSFAEVVSGQPAPDFSLQDTNGNTHMLSIYKGKIVVLEWINHECPFVKKHYDSGNMQQLQKDAIANDIVWLSVNSSAPGKQGFCSPEEANKLTMEKQASPTAVLLDPDGAVGKLYGAQTTPHMYVIDAQGILVYQGAIDDKPSVDPADITTSKNYVKAALDAMLAGTAVADASTKAYGCSVKY